MRPEACFPLQRVLNLRCDEVLQGWVAYFRLTKLTVCRKSLMAGSGTGCLLCSDRNGSASTHGPRNLMQAGLDKVRAWQSAISGHGPW
jgi:hypothetical protein